MEYPQHIIINKRLSATIYLPDKEKGFYRGSRFEWGGNMIRMTCDGRVIFSPWTDYKGPQDYESVAGPMEEFSHGPTAEGGLGLEEAKTGDPWLKIGVGVLERTATMPFDFSETHPLIEGGEWSWETGRDWISFTHKLDYPARGWGYEYTKKITLDGDKASFVLDHELVNTGREILDFAQYNHNFFTLGNCPAGPDWKLTFPYDLTPETDHKGIYLIGGHRVGFLGDMSGGGKVTWINGDFGGEGYRFSVDNSRENIRVDVSSDTPMDRLKFWSCETTVCPEPYIRKVCRTGEKTVWSIRYDIRL